MTRCKECGKEISHGADDDSSRMAINSAPHAERILEALVLHGNTFDIKVPMFSALIEGTKAVLKQYEDRHRGGVGVLEMQTSNIIRFARAIAPGMEDAGMEVPK